MTIDTPKVNVEQVKALAQDLRVWIKEKTNAPILIRVAWHDSGTYDKDSKKGFPQAGGADGSIRFKPECDHAANAGLIKAITELEQFHEKYPEISYADLYQLASAIGIEVCGGPKIPLRFGRIDCATPDQVPEEGNLPGPDSPDPKISVGEYLKKIFYRMGFSDKELVVLSGAHTLGRVHKNRSGATDYESTKYTENVKQGATVGGQSWTSDWLKFNNNYFKGLLNDSQDEQLLKLPSDKILVEDPALRKYVVKYAEDEKVFFDDYAIAHSALSEKGSKFNLDNPIAIDY